MMHHPNPSAAEQPTRRPRLPATVIALGMVSLLTDTASEMIYPLLPAFLLSLPGFSRAMDHAGAALALTATTLLSATFMVVPRCSEL